MVLHVDHVGLDLALFLRVILLKAAFSNEWDKEDVLYLKYIAILDGASPGAGIYEQQKCFIQNIDHPEETTEVCSLHVVAGDRC